MIVDRFEQGPFGGPDTFTKSAGPTADTIHLDLRVAGSVDLEIEGARAFLSSPPVALGGGNQLVFELLHGGDDDLILTGVGQELDNLSESIAGFHDGGLGAGASYVSVANDSTTGTYWIPRSKGGGRH